MIAAQPTAPHTQHRIRPLKVDDLDQVAVLRQDAFRNSQQRTAADLTHYLRHMFFDSPLRDDDIPSLVYEGPGGRIDGFLGVVVERMRLGPRPVRAAIATQLMASADGQSLVGRKLARAVVDGRQDFTMSDTANTGARTLWKSIGGQTAFGYSLRWIRPLRPMQFMIRDAGRAPARAALPLAVGIDVVLHRRAWKALDMPGTDRVTEFFPPDAISLIEELGAHRTLRPAYDRTTLAWLMNEVGGKRGAEAVPSYVVHDALGHSLGWFSYTGDRTGVAHVIHLEAHRRYYRRVLLQLIARAYADGALALSGRTDPAVIEELSALGCQFRWDGPWTCLHTSDSAIRIAIERGDAYLSRMEGEWWMRF